MLEKFKSKSVKLSHSSASGEEIVTVSGTVVQLFLKRLLTKDNISYQVYHFTLWGNLLREYRKFMCHPALCKTLQGEIK